MSLVRPEDLSKLLLLLQNENLRSAHLNAFPGKSIAKFDLSLLDTISDGFSATLLKNLLTKAHFQQKISIQPAPQAVEQPAVDPAPIIKRLQKLYLRALDYERERGFKVVYLGYPLVQRVQHQSSDKKILAPLLLWEVYIQPAAGYKKWAICRERGSTIRVNTALQLYQKIEGEPSIPDCAEDGLVTEQALQELLQELLATQYYQEATPDLLDVALAEGFSALPERRDVLFKERAGTPYYKILNSAVLGIFKASKEAIISDLQEYIGMEGLEVPGASIQAATHAALPLDPSQRKGLPVLRAEQNLVIHGPPGTGKSQVLTGIISAAVAKKQKILVVCEKYTALEVIKKNLEAILPDLPVALIIDVTKDRKKIALMARAMGEQRSDKQNRIRVDHHKKYEKEHEAHVTDLKKAILFQDNWTTVVGKYLALQSYPSIKVPQKVLDKWMAKDERLIEAIHELDALKEQVPHYALFKQHIEDLLTVDAIQLKGALDRITQALEVAIEQAHRAAQESFPRMQEFVLKTVAELQRQHQALVEVLYRWEQLRPREKLVFQKGSGFIQFLYRLFSKHYQTVEATHTELTEKESQLYQFLAQDWSLDYLPTTSMLIEQTKTRSDELLENLRLLENDFNSQADFARAHDPVFVKMEQDWQRQLKAAAQSLQLLKGHLLAQDLAKKDSFLADYRLLSGELTQLETYKRFKGLLEELSISDRSPLFKALFKEHDWACRAEQALYAYAITRNSTRRILSDDHCLKKLQQAEDNYQQMVKVTMHNACIDLQDSGIQELLEKGYSLNQVFNLRGGKGKPRNSLKKINQQFRDEFTQLYPILLTTPESAATLFRGLRNYFDLVIFDEASQVNLEDAISTLFKGKTIVVAGDEHQMPPSSFFSRANDFEEVDDDDFSTILDSESLLDFAINNHRSFENLYLDFHYRSEHPALINFSNAAFYGRLLPMPPRYHYRPIEYKWVGGTYKQQTNADEAAAVVEILKKMGTQYAGSLPSIGIATLNLKQRNLIFEKIAEAVNDDPVFGQLYEQLVSADLFIKNLENIQGDERDIIIISTTFGKDEHGRFIQNFGPINQAKGYRLLNVLITRARQKVIVLNSIPSVKINAYQEIIRNGAEQGAMFSGRGIFYAYLSYCKAISQGDKDTAQAILNFLARYNPKYQTGERLGLLEYPFETEVYRALTTHFQEDELQLQKAEGAFRIDLILSPAKHPGLRIAIECDGATYPESYESYHYDIHRQKMLEKSGYEFIRVWSRNWFIDYKREKRKLITKIKQIMAGYLTRQNQLPPHLQPLYLKEKLEKKIIVVGKNRDKTALNSNLEEKNAEPEVLMVKKGVMVELHEKTHHKVLNFKMSEQNNLNHGQLGVDTPLGRLLIGATEGEEVPFGEYRYEVKKIIKL